MSSANHFWNPLHALNHVQLRLAVAAAVFVLRAISSTVIGGPISVGNGSGVGSETEYALAGPMIWTIDNQEVAANPVSGRWRNTLWGASIGQDLIVPRDTVFVLEESLIVAGNVGWTDWNVSTVSEGWILSVDLFDPNGTFFRDRAGLNVPGLQISGLGTSNLVFSFDELSPSSEAYSLRMRPQFVGSGTFTGPLILEQFTSTTAAVPEPASFLLVLSIIPFAFLRLKLARGI